MLEVKGLKKTFKMSKKQQKIEKTKEKIKVAFHLMRVREKSLESLAQTAPEKPQRSEF